MTVHVPIDVLARLGGDEFAWQVPALREELVTELIRSLPKSLRRNFVPAPDTARAVMAGIDPDSEPLLDGLQRELRRRSGVLVPIDAFDLDKLPPHLQVTFSVSPPTAPRSRGARTSPVCRRRSTTTQSAVADAVGGELEQTGLRGWPDDLDELPRVVERTVGGRAVRGYPAFVDTGNAVDLRVFATTVEQDRAMRPGIRRMLRLSVPSPIKSVERQLDPRTRLTLGTNPDGSLSALLDDCADAAADTLVPAPVWTRSDFAALRDQVAAKLAATTVDVVGRVEKVMSAATMCNCSCHPNQHPRKPTRSTTSARSWTACCPPGS